MRVIIIRGTFFIILSLLMQSCGVQDNLIKIEKFEHVKSWTSPYWGYNAPKIVRNSKGELWTVIFQGKYGEQQAQIMKRDIDGVWHKGKIIKDIYQPCMLFIDTDGRLNYVLNAQYEPVSHYRSEDDDNLNNFSLVAKGNGTEDGRGWYAGVGINDSTMYLSYVTIEYDLYLTWKNVTDKQWHKAILLVKGLQDTITGNHSWLYPRFNFKDGKGYITASSTVDGSKYNTYDKVQLVTFSLDNPAEFKTEIIFNGTVGYYSYSYDALITSHNKLICGHDAGRYKYGDKKKDVAPEGTYVSVKDLNESEWKLYQVSNRYGGIALHEGEDGTIWALLTEGGWDTDNVMNLKKSVDDGKTWQTVNNNVLERYPEMKHSFFIQLIHKQSGSTLGKGIDGVFSNHTDIKQIDGVYDFDLLYIHIDTAH